VNIDFDLFGLPIPDGRGKRGRPVHFVTPENRNKVSMLLALGWTNERIANALGISQPTLRKNYFHELKRKLLARDMMDAKRIEKLWQLGMEKDNVAALKEFARLVEQQDAKNAARNFAGDDDYDDDTPKTEKVGKKEQAQLDAEAIGAGSDGWDSDLAFRGRPN
jgi:hypothetical protein